MKYVGYVYKIYCIVTSKIYIGITTRDINIRWNQHKNESKNPGNNHFHLAIQKYGWDAFEKSILVKLEADSKEILVKSLKKLEIYYIEENNSYNEGYNSTIGGDGIINDAQNKKVEVYNELGEYLGQCESRVEAANKYKVLASSVSDCCNRIIYSSGWLDGLRLIFRNEDDTVTSEDLQKLKRIRKNIKVPVKAYDYYTGELLNTYNSISEAADDTGLRADLISKCAKKERKSTGQGEERTVWRLLNEDYIPQYQFEGFVNGKSIGKYVDTYIIKETLGILPSSISNAVNGKSRHAGLYKGQPITWKKLIQ